MIGQKIAQLREAAGLTQTELGERIGLTQGAVSKLETEARRLKLDVALALARALGVDAAELLTPPTVKPAQVRRSEPLNPMRSARQFASAAAQAAKLPVLAGARGGVQQMFTGDGPLDWVEMLPSLRDVRGAYAVWVVGDSMSPRYRAGQILYVHPTRPRTPGCGVVVGLKTGEVMVKEYVGPGSAGAVVLREYQPEPREFEVTADDRVCCDVVVGLLEP